MDRGRTYDEDVAALCPHGLPASECLICPALPAAAPVPEVAQVPQPRGSRFILHAAGVVAAIALIGVAAWVVAGVVFALLHVLELVAVGAVAGWVGYRLGHFRGSRDHR